jgi:hypothetical protein
MIRSLDDKFSEYVSLIHSVLWRHKHRPAVNIPEENIVVFLHYKIYVYPAAGVSALVFIRHVNL